MTSLHDLDQLVDAMTLDEQVSLLAGTDYWHTAAVPRLDVPAMRVSDGPAGARGTRFGGPASINVPCGTALAASFDPSLVQAVGELLGRETRAKGARVLLAPTVNLHRTPVGGRNFECMSEDPYLTARTAVAYVRGVQSQQVACCIKHFVGNDTEHERMTIDSRIDEVTLRELYLQPFEAAVVEAQVMSVMTAYNRINGPYAADSEVLIDGVLRGEWGFDGCVISDWHGLHSTVEGLVAGLDLEMPGPSRHRGQLVLDAVAAGRLDVALVRRAARSVLGLMARTGALDDGGPAPETTRDDPADLALVRRAGAAGMVLLRNQPVDGTPALPLDPSVLRRVAVIGPNAREGRPMGGGSAFVTPTRVVHPLDGLRTRLGSAGVEVVHAEGCRIDKRLPALDNDWCTPLRVAFFDDASGLDGGTPVRESVPKTSRLTWFGDPVHPGRPGAHFAARLTTTFTPPVDGVWTIGLTSAGDARLMVDGELVLDSGPVVRGGAFFGLGKAEITAEITLEAGRPYALEAELRQWVDDVDVSAVHIGARAPQLNDPVAEAADLAATCDVAVVVVGTNDEWECEGWDRADIGLPGDQDRLIRAVAAVCPRTVVVINAGSPVAMDWLDEVDSVVMAWFSGQELGNALADVLCGDVEPSGRLPVTFPRHLSETPAADHHPGREGVAYYAEGRLVGYRWYEATGIEPLFPFGFGLGYADAAIAAARTIDAHTVEVDLTNPSARDGVAVVQVYAAWTDTTDRDRPPLRLVGVASVPVGGGAEVTTQVALDPRSYLTWSVEAQDWVVAPGPVELRVGTSATDVAVRLAVPGRD